MQLKRFLTSVLVVIVLLSVAVFSVAAEDAADATLSVVPTAGATAAVDGTLVVTGDTVTVDVMLNNNPGVAYLFVEMEYDTSVLTLTGAESSGIFPIFGDIDVATPGEISVMADFLGDYANVTEESVVVMTLTFSVTGHGDAKVAFVDGTLASNEDLDDVALTRVDAVLAAHTYETSVTDPDCTNAGYTTYACSETDCDKSYNVAGEGALGHTEVPGTPVAATCTSTGLTEGVYCSVCGEWIVPQEVTPITGHTIIDIEKVDAVCGSDGHEAGRGCKFCD